jgi:hypothetical protein
MRQYINTLKEKVSNKEHKENLTGKKKRNQSRTNQLTPSKTGLLE